MYELVKLRYNGQIKKNKKIKNSFVHGDLQRSLMILIFWCIAQDKWSSRQISWLISWLNEDKAVFLELQRKR